MPNFRIARQSPIEFTLDKCPLLFKGDFETIIKVSHEIRLSQEDRIVNL